MKIPCFFLSLGRECGRSPMMIEVNANMNREKEKVELFLLNSSSKQNRQERENEGKKSHSYHSFYHVSMNLNTIQEFAEQ